MPIYEYECTVMWTVHEEVIQKFSDKAVDNMSPNVLESCKS